MNGQEEAQNAEPLFAGVVIAEKCSEPAPVNPNLSPWG